MDLVVGFLNGEENLFDKLDSLNAPAVLYGPKKLMSTSSVNTSRAPHGSTIVEK